ncbi:MAG: FAS1-like dehydratase domain-containing protein [Candidatus Syntropharchaeia archaeon]
MVDKNAVGKEAGPYVYIVWDKKFQQFANAVGDKNPVYFDEEAAKKAGYDGIIAPPAFANAPFAISVWPSIELSGIPTEKLLHGAQEFEYISPLKPTEKLTTRFKITDISEKKGMYFVTVDGETVNERGEKKFTYKCTLVERGD